MCATDTRTHTYTQALFGYHCAQKATTRIECWANSCTSNWYIYLPCPVWAIWVRKTEGNNLSALHFIELSRGNLIKGPRWQCCGQSNRLVINQSSSAEGRSKRWRGQRANDCCKCQQHVAARKKLSQRKWAQRGNLKLRNSNSSDGLLDTHYSEKHRKGERKQDK